MKFSVVTPVLNGMPYLPACIRSVRQQRPDHDVEHIVLDAGSTDGSRDWLVANKGPEELVFERDDGLSDALVKGFTRARGEIFCWLNADDSFEPGAFSHVADAFAAHPSAVLIAGGCLLVDPSGGIVGAAPMPLSGARYDLLNTANNIPQPAVFFRSNAYAHVGGISTSWKLAMDVDLWMRLTRNRDAYLIRDIVLARFRVHAGSLSVKHDTMAAVEEFRIRWREGLRLSSPAMQRLLRRIARTSMRRFKRPFISNA